MRGIILFAVLFLGVIFQLKAQQTKIFAELKGNPMNLTDWVLAGDAGSADTPGDADTDNDELILSKAEQSTSGSCFYNKPLKLSLCKNWTVEFSFRIFDGTSADGLAFCFIKNRPAGQQAGQNIGIPNNPEGIMIVFDTHNNDCSTDPTEINPELQIRYGDGTENYSECGPGPTLYDLGWLRSNDYSKAKIVYKEGVVEVFINGASQLTGNYDADFEGYFGFTSATGASNDNHSIKDVSIYTENNIFQESVAQSFCEGDTLVLDGGEGFDSYLWLDGSTDRYLAITDSGTFGVKVDDDCNTILKKFDIKKQPLPDIKLGEDTLICGQGSLTFMVDANFEKYVWDDASAKPERTVDKTGDYWVQVEDHLGCIGIDSINVTFSELPEVSIEGGPLICKNTSLTLDAKAGFKEYLWNNNQTTQTSTINGPGQYWVKVTDQFGCNGGDTIIVELTPSVLPVLGNDTAICEFTEIKLSPGVFDSYLWNDGSSLPELKATKNGIYWVKTKDEFGCDGIDSLNIALFDLPVVNLGEDTAICLNQNLKLESQNKFEEYLWSTGDLTDAIVVDKEGLFWVKVKDGNGCENTDSIAVLINQLPAINLGEDTAFCEGEPGVLMTTGVFKNYQWSDGSSLPKLIVGKAGTFWLKVLDNNGCENSDTINVLINPSPIVDLGTDTFFCDNESVKIAAKEYIKYLWQTGATDKEISVETGGSIWLKVWDENGCTQTDTIGITSLLTPQVNLGNDTSICLDNELVLDASFPRVLYLWNNGSTSPKVIVSTPGIYEVTLNNNCGTATDKITIKKDYACDCPFYYPNAFTPNNDGVNDGFKVSFACTVNQYKLMIYNRWGEVVFTSDNPAEVWLGPEHSTKPQGIYVWSVTGTLFNTEGDYFPLKKMGTVALIK